MSDKPSPSEIASKRYAAVLYSRRGDVTDSASPRVRVTGFLDLHRDAWQLAVRDVEAMLPGWPHGDEDDQQSLEAEQLAVGIEIAFESLPQSTERVCGAMLDRFLDWLESPDGETPFITPLTHAVGSALYRALPGSAESLLGFVGSTTTVDEASIDPDLIEFDFDEEHEEAFDEHDSSDPWSAPEPDPWAASESAAWSPPAPVDEPAWQDHQSFLPEAYLAQPEVDAAEEISGLHSFPALDSAPVNLIATAGGFFPADWDTYLRVPQRPTDGAWVLNHYPAEERLVLQFTGKNFSAFAEIFKEDIAGARVAAKGLNMVIEVQAKDGDHFIAVGPRKRLKSIFLQLGFSL